MRPPEPWAWHHTLQLKEWMLQLAQLPQAASFRMKGSPHRTEEPFLLVLSDLATTLQSLLTTDADEAARASGWVRRCRRFRGATLVQTLVLGWLQQPRAPVDGLLETAADLGVEISAQALDKRFTRAGTQCLA